MIYESGFLKKYKQISLSVQISNALVIKRQVIAVMTVLLMIALFMIAIVPANALNLKDYPRLQESIQPLIQKNVYTQAELNAIFKTLQLREEVIRKKANSAESKLTWGGGRRPGGYKGIFLQPERIQLGVEFWNVNKESLTRASEEFGLEPQIIVAIIGVETKFGQNKGQHSVLESISTFVDRGSQLQFNQLPIFLELVKKGYLSIDAQGSYSGAMGIPQFISSSYRDFGVDFDGDKQVDLISNTDDAIGSVANYFKKHYWKKNQPVMISVQARSKEAAQQLSEMAVRKVNSRSKAKTTLAQVSFLLKNTPSDLSMDTPVGIFEFLDKNGKAEYFLGQHNFYVIMKYNHSYLYGRAVYDLSERILQAYESQ